MTLQPPPGIHARDPMTIDQVAAAASALIASARAAGLTPPCALNITDYGPPSASLFMYDGDSVDIWAELRQWADRYGAELATRVTHNPANSYVYTEFHNGGIRYEIYTILHPAPQDPDDDTDDDTDDTDDPPQAA
jgi:hypothetical protein